MADEPLMRARSVTKSYGDLRAVDDVELAIEPGEIFALLGPNGAGKTTLIGCITGLVTGFEGSIEVAGFDVVDDYRITRRLVGLVPQELNYDAFFNVRDVLSIQGGYFGVRPDSGRVDELLESFSLTDKAEANTRWLSGGMKRRLMICKALVHDPVLLFLDEPTAGVDVELREELWEYVRGLRARGTTIVLTTHYIEEAEELADRIGILHKGRLRRVAPRDELMREFGQRVLEITTARELGADFGAELTGTGWQLERPLPNKLALTYVPGRDDDPTDRLIRGVIDAGHTITGVETQQSSLEQIFRDLVAAEEDHDAQRREQS